MLVFGFICAVIIGIFAIVWIYRKISIGTKYVKTVGHIINFKNMVPLVDKRMVSIGERYVYTECDYQGDVYVTVKFTGRDGEELTRRYNSSEPVHLKINEHKRSVHQYISVFPDWQIGKKVKIFYNPKDTLDIIVGKAPPLIKKKE